MRKFLDVCSHVRAQDFEYSSKRAKRSYVSCLLDLRLPGGYARAMRNYF